MGSKSKGRSPEEVTFSPDFSYYLGAEGISGEAPMSWIPPVDIYESEDCYVLDAELPGVRREDVQVEVKGSVITIRGRRCIETCNEENYHRLEGMRGMFRRSFSLPEPLERAKLQSRLKDGVLHLVIHKSSRSGKDRS